MHEEDSLQISVAAYLEKALPREAFFFHPPNGGSRNKLEAYKLKRMGVKPGVPDLIILYQGRTILIELKAKKGVVSQAQKDLAAKLGGTGFKIYLARSLDEVCIALEDAKIPLRAFIL